MRYIVVFLVLANLAYLAWSQLRPLEITEAEQPAQRALLNTGLMLVSEFDVQSEGQARLNPQADAENNGDSARICSIIGNFGTVDDARAFLAELPSQDYKAELQLTGETLAPLHRVFIPPLASLNIAAITLDGLSEALEFKGLEVESYLITRGMLANGIALGVYEQADRALEVSGQVLELGYPVEIEEIPRSSGEIQVMIEALDSLSLGSEEWLVLSTNRPGLQRTENLCETIAQGL